MYKERDSKNGKLTIGPIWDYDLAFGNADYYNGAKLYDWQMDFRVQSDPYQIPFWWQRLMQDSSFTKRINIRWRELRQNVLNIPRIHASIDSMAQLLDEAQKRNFERWPILGTYVWPNAFIGQTYSEELSYLKQWVNLRALWMDVRMPEQLTGVAETTQMPTSFVLEQNYPNPIGAAFLSAQNFGTTIVFQLPQADQVTLKIFNITGHEVASLLDQRLQAGRHEVRFDAKKLTSGIYFYRLQAGKWREEKKMLILR
jgi:hypothetical protein